MLTSFFLSFIDCGLTIHDEAVTHFLFSRCLASSTRHVGKIDDQSGQPKYSSILARPVTETLARPAARINTPPTRAMKGPEPTESARSFSPVEKVSTEVLVERMTLLADCSMSILIQWV